MPMSRTTCLADEFVLYIHHAGQSLQLCTCEAEVFPGIGIRIGVEVEANVWNQWSLYQECGLLLDKIIFDVVKLCEQQQDHHAVRVL
jgi:hypothetical protein